MTLKTIIGSNFPKVVIPLIESADINIDIIVFDWRVYMDDSGNPVSLFNQAIVAAKRRGVVVRAIVNQGNIQNFLQKNGCLAKQLCLKNLVHCKLMIIDGQKMILGSHNYTNAAFCSNFEISSLIEDEESVKICQKFFDDMWT